jgi:hypothetical protein
MKRFLQKATFCSLVGLAAALSACHDETTASAATNGLTTPGKGTVNATASKTEANSLSISCVLGCCSKKKAYVTNNQ